MWVNSFTTGSFHLVKGFQVTLGPPVSLKDNHTAHKWYSLRLFVSCIEVFLSSGYSRLLTNAQRNYMCSNVLATSQPHPSHPCKPLPNSAPGGELCTQLLWFTWGNRKKYLEACFQQLSSWLWPLACDSVDNCTDKESSARKMTDYQTVGRLPWGSTCPSISPVTIWCKFFCFSLNPTVLESFDNAIAVQHHF